VSVQSVATRGFSPVPGPLARKGGLRLSDVVKIYGASDAGLLAVDHCTFDVPPGEITVVVGPSGCGKTTLLNAIAGFHSVSSGSIFLDDEMLCGPGKPKAQPGPDRIVVFQNGALFPWKTNIENVTFGPIMQGRLSRAEANEKARDMMADAGLRDIEHNYPGEISSGVRRRVEIVRALMNDPKILLLDEPAAGLPESEVPAFAAVVRSVRDEHGAGVLLIDHNMALIMDVCDRIHVLDQGMTLAEGAPDEIRSNLDVAAAYLGESAVHADDEEPDA